MKLLNKILDLDQSRKIPYLAGKKRTAIGPWNYFPIWVFVLFAFAFSGWKTISQNSSQPETLSINQEKCKVICNQLISCIEADALNKSTYKDLIISGCYVKCPKHIKNIESCMNTKQSCNESFSCIMSNYK